MSIISAQQAAQYLSAAGFSGETLVKMVAIAYRESRYKTEAHRTDADPSKMSGDRGLLQINAIWDDQLKRAGIIQSPQDLFNPAVNAKAAKYVFDHQGLPAWAASSGGHTSGGDPLYGTNVDAARQAVATMGAAMTTGTPNPNATPTSLPTDGQIVHVSNGRTIILFALPGGNAIFYDVKDQASIKGRPVVQMTIADFNKNYAHPVHGGDATELAPVAQQFGTFGAAWNSAITQFLGKSNPASKDPGVLRVIAEYLGRPDMSDAEIQNKLKDTPFWQAHTQGQLEWDSLSNAEKQARRGDAASRMQAAWFEFGGVKVGAKDPRVMAKLEDVASGKMSMSQWQEQFLKPRAKAMPESPWARQVRTEGETQRERPIALENTAGHLRETLAKYGLTWTESQVAKWAAGIVTKKQSDDDFLNTVKDQAMSKYGNWKKNRDMETVTEAAPWIDTYNRVMETQGDVFTPQVQKALNAGQNSYDFEKVLKQAPAWLETKNARNDMMSMAGQVSQMFGYT